jgi:hypothetical protein
MAIKHYIRNYHPLYLGGDPYTYSNVGAAETITLPLTTSFFTLSCEGVTVEEVTTNGDLTAILPDGGIKGTTVHFQFAEADADNDIKVQFTGVDSSNDELLYDLSTLKPGFATLVWLGSYWIVAQKTLSEPAIS